jgi:hypothetical protein
VKRAGTRAPWSLVLALSIAVVLIVGVASAANPGGWTQLEQYNAPNAGVLNGAVYALSAETSYGLLVGGNFNFKTRGGKEAAHLAIWYPNPGAWDAYPGLNGDVHAIAWDSDHRRLYAGGTFTNAGGNPDADFLAVWNGTDWAPFCSPAPAFGGNVTALQIIGSTLYVGGTFQNAAGIASADYLLACDLNTGAARSTIVRDGDLTGAVYALTRDSKGTLYAGGQFINMAGIPAADHVAAYDGTWHAMGAGTGPGGGAVTDYVRSIASNGTDVYIGTDSVNVAGIPQADHVARWNGSAWSALAANSAGTDGWLPASAFIYAIAAKDAQVVVTGSFQNADGNATADNIASFDGTAWNPLLGNGTGNGPWIGNGLAVAILGKEIVAGGNFTKAGMDGRARFVARYAPLPNRFIISGVTGSLSTGTVSYTVDTPGAGTLILSGVRVRRVTVATPSSPATATLAVQATGRWAKTLNRLGHLSVDVTIAFTPTGGSPESVPVAVVLKKSR